MHGLLNSHIEVKPILVVFIAQGPSLIVTTLLYYPERLGMFDLGVYVTRYSKRYLTALASSTGLV